MRKNTWRTYEKRICAVVLIFTITISMVFFGGNIHIFPTMAEGEQVLAGENIITRGVIDSISQLKKDSSKELGSKENPFVVLELVPTLAYAEFGYLIGGCEPVAIENMFGSADITSVSTSTNDSLSIQRTADFFPDEPQSNKDAYGKEPYVLNTGIYNGYYELVEAGSGNFKRVFTPQEDGSQLVSFVKAEGGEANFIWHTVNPFETGFSTYNSESAIRHEIGYLEDRTHWNFYIDYHYSAEQILFADPLDMQVTEIGQRIFTKRYASDVDPVYRYYDYYEYINYENFLQYTLKVEASKCKDYSIVVKTITPEELNGPDGEKWITNSNLIVMSPKSHIGRFPALYAKHNRLGKTIALDNLPDGFAKNDISWERALAIYKKVNDKNNHASIIIDDGIYNQESCVCYTDPSGKTVGKANISLDLLDFSFRDTGYDYSGLTGYNANIYKLCVMLLSMDANLFTQLYLTPDPDTKKCLVENGEYSMQSGDAKSYWNFSTFLLIPSYEYLKNYSYDPGTYWKSKDCWQNYGYCNYPTNEEFKYFVKDHVYTYKGDNSISQDYIKPKPGTWTEGSKFSNYVDYLAGNSNASSADAVTYILGIQEHAGGEEDLDTSSLTLNILDLEPSVETGYDATKNGSYPIWRLKESYIRMLVPAFKGQVHITHMTTAEFNSSTEDLCSKYQMIYMGLDVGAYNLKKDETGKIFVPNWNDQSGLKELIYTHTGDLLYSSEIALKAKNRSKSVKFAYGVTYPAGAAELRFMGNDITRRRENDLIKFAESKHPIVAASELFSLNEKLIDKNSYIYDFVRSLKTKTDGEGNPLFCLYDDIGKASAGTQTVYDSIISSIEGVVTIKEYPTLYDGTTVSSNYVHGAGEANKDTYKFKNKNFLQKSSGRPVLRFVVDIPEDGYAYALYVDSNQNGKFDEEPLKTHTIAKGENREIEQGLQSNLVGLVQWKLDVYQIANPNIKSSMEGCSAVEKKAGTSKISIKVLQVTPNDSSSAGYLNLQNNDLFKNYYKNLEDYNIEVTSIKLSEYLDYFKDKGFTYDISQGITDTNPNPEKLSSLGGNLSSYDMLIVGFADAFGNDDLKNDNGAVDFIQYFIDRGKGVLLTHDLSSMYCDTYYDYTNHKVVESFGYTTNKMLRDYLGMNAYGLVSTHLDSTYIPIYQAYIENKKNEALAETAAMKASDANLVGVLAYSDNYTNATQGFTYYAIKRMAWAKEYWNKNKDGDLWYIKNYELGYKMPYTNMIKNANGQYACTDTWSEASAGGKTDNKTSGINDNNDLTTRAERVNEGQITQYPYKIDENLTIAPTHGQWFQLNMEDEDVTVWYTLGDDGKHPMQESKEGVIKDDERKRSQYGDGTAITYGVSPKDGANNYYIYSKKNVFYSGVGHSTVNGDMEAKLFVNTMIAAYRASFEPPHVDVINKDAAVVADNSFTIEMPEDYDLEAVTLDEAGNNAFGAFENISGTYRVMFTVVDNNSTSSTLHTKIGFKKASGDYVYLDQLGIAVHHCDDEGNDLGVVSCNLGHSYDAMENGQSYYFDYPKEYLEKCNNPSLGVNEKLRDIQIEIHNDLIASEKGITSIHMSIAPLFVLD